MAYDKTHILHPANKAAIIKDISEMLDEHGETINKAVDRSSKQKRSLGISVEIDKSHGQPTFGTVFRMVTVDPLKDRRQTQAEDPDQLTIPFDQQEPVKPIEVITIKKKTAKKKAAK